AERVAKTKELAIPVGFALAGPRLADAIRAARGAAGFFTLPADRAADLAELRALTDKPLLLRLPPALADDALDALLDAAISAGIDGCVATAGAPCPLLEAGEVDGPFLRD